MQSRVAEEIGKVRHENVVTTLEKIKTPPSCVDGTLCQNEERLFRFLACDLISASGQLLRVPFGVIATAQCLLHRFYYTTSFQKVSIVKGVLGCVFLACKLEECPRQKKNVVQVVSSLLSHKAPESGSYKHAMFQSPLFLGRYTSQQWLAIKYMSQQLVEAELDILLSCGFQAHVRVPVAYLLPYLQALDLTDLPDIPQKVWDNFRLSLKTPLCVIYQNHVIAAGVLYYTMLQEQIPMVLEPEPWWSLFDAQECDLVTISAAILDAKAYS